MQKSLFSSGLRNLFSIDYYHEINVIKHEVFTIKFCVYLYFTANRNPWGPNFAFIPCNIKLVWVFEISCAKLGKVRFFQTLLSPTQTIKLCMRILLYPGFNENCACNLWVYTCKVISKRPLTGIQQLSRFTWYIKFLYEIQ